MIACCNYITLVDIRRYCLTEAIRPRNISSHISYLPLFRCYLTVPFSLAIQAVEALSAKDFCCMLFKLPYYYIDRSIWCQQKFTFLRHKNRLQRLEFCFIGYNHMYSRPGNCCTSPMKRAKCYRISINLSDESNNILCIN